MTSREYRLDLSMPLEGLNPLLPRIAGIIECITEATFSDIQTQLELELEKKLPDSAIEAALDCGIKLGVFHMKREFKVCKEFTTKELKKIKNVGDYLISEKKVNSFNLGSVSNQKAGLMEYVKEQRDQRKKKMAKKKRHLKVNVMKEGENSSDLSKYLCDRCQESLERELKRRLKPKREALKNNVYSYMEGSQARFGSLSSIHSIDSFDKQSTISSSIKSGTQSEEGKAEQKQQTTEKSKLLVEKNPIEFEPPYCDMFT